MTPGTDNHWIDLNADVGEAVSAEQVADERAVMASVSSVNIACGGHAGDEASMRQAIRDAAAGGIAVGAHPSYPDRAQFGRGDIDMEPASLRESLSEQIGRLADIARSEGVPLTHCKPHGALYHAASRDQAVAVAILEACRDQDPGMHLVGMAGSRALAWWRKWGASVHGEAFADRAYNADGTLRSRGAPGAVISDPATAADRAVRIAIRRAMPLEDGTLLQLDAETICVHSDTPGAAEIAERIVATLRERGVAVRPFADR